MFKNYFKTAWRNIWKNKTFSIINIIGLSVGIACSLLILFHVKEELSYDRDFANADRIFRVSMETSDDAPRKWAATSPVLATEMQKDVPEISSVVRFHRYFPYQLLSSTNASGVTKRFEEKNGFFADSGAIKMFGLQFISGDPSTALSEPDCIVVTESMAKKYFGLTDVLGKVINEDEKKVPYKITGVIKNFDFPTHLQFDYLVSMVTLNRYMDQRSLENRGWSGFYNYVLLNDATSKTRAESRLPEFAVKFYGQTGELRDHVLNTRKLVLQPITDIHLHSKLEKELSVNSDITYVYIFSVAALFILLVAAVNFINISTTLAFNRMKEIGMRKVVGATKKELVAQFLGESFLITILSAALAIVFFKAMIPFYQQLTNNRFDISQLITPVNMGLFMILIIVISLLAGIYPAWFVARFNPVTSLKGKKVSGSSVQLVRKGLTIFQFVVSVFMIFGTLVIYRQMNLFHNKNLGFDKEQVIAITMYNDLWNSYGALIGEMKKNPGIISYSATSTLPGQRFGFYGFDPLSGSQNETIPGSTRVLWADDNILNTLHIPLKEGRNFFNQFPNIKKPEFILNESAVKAFHFSNPIGKRILVEQDTGEVVGVVKDFNFASLHAEVEPLVIQYNPYKANYLLVKVQPNQVPKTLKFFEDNFRLLSPSSKFTFSFLDDQLNQLYDAENRMSTVFKAFAGFAILISCLGLFGLSAYSARMRVKEIGIRKVLGASEYSLVVLLSKDFVRLVLIAIIIALPISWLTMSNWLSNFAYHVPINAFVFFASGIAAILVALTTVSFQAIKTAILNPVSSLKTD